MNKYKIREMNLNDYLKVFDLWSNTEGMGLSDSDSEESISKFLKRNDGHSFVCTDAEEIIGTILCGHDGRRGFLYHVAVSKEYRKNGIGKRLVESALDSLKKSGIIKCHLMVLGNNKIGNQYWNNAGWIKRDDILIFSKDT
ncbi:GNAT family N-acetyltransferase [Saccharibacillus deserti]|uniref:GNAT family N-acetyltransferase n=1 Tax=Saccharibacillus deserti TaxID=1634444 RepID=UPI001FE51658|nr:GNAT family N-acetyltransferase [Saccharibacillus deserti]